VDGGDDCEATRTEAVAGGRALEPGDVGRWDLPGAAPPGAQTWPDPIAEVLAEMKRLMKKSSARIAAATTRAIFQPATSASPLRTERP